MTSGHYNELMTQNHDCKDNFNEFKVSNNTLNWRLGAGKAFPSLREVSQGSWTNVIFSSFRRVVCSISPNQPQLTSSNVYSDLAMRCFNFLQAINYCKWPTRQKQHPQTRTGLIWYVPKSSSHSESPVSPRIHDSSFQSVSTLNSDHTDFWKISIIYNGIDMCAISDSVSWDDAPESSQTAALPLSNSPEP